MLILLTLATAASGASVRELLTQSSHVTVHSTSRQFVVGAPRFLTTPEGSTNRAWVGLEPGTLAVSCERIKGVFLRELGAADLWAGRVFVVINPTMTNNQPAVIGARRYLDGWQYQIELPQRLAPEKLVRGMVHVLLLEMANRTAALRSAEIPLWVSEGLTQQIVHGGLRDLIAPQPELRMNEVRFAIRARNTVGPDPLEATRQRLATHAAMTFTRMSELTGEELPEETWKTFQASAHLFLNRLLAMPGAPAQLSAMLLQLPHHLNWQTAFLSAFQERFPRLLDVEKWWSVVLVHFSGFDSAHAWSIQTASERLEDILRPAVLHSDGAEGQQRRSRLRLQQIMSEWDYLRHRPVLQDAVRQLGLFRVRLPIELIGLADEYRQTLEGYMARRERAGISRPLPGLQAAASDRLLQETIERLDDLDRRRADVAVPQSASPAEKTPPE